MRRPRPTPCLFPPPSPTPPRPWFPWMFAVVLPMWLLRCETGGGGAGSARRSTPTRAHPPPGQLPPTSTPTGPPGDHTNSIIPSSKKSHHDTSNGLPSVDHDWPPEGVVGVARMQPRGLGEFWDKSPCWSLGRGPEEVAGNLAWTNCRKHRDAPQGSRPHTAKTPWEIVALLAHCGAAWTTESQLGPLKSSPRTHWESTGRVAGGGGDTGGH